MTDFIIVVILAVIIGLALTYIIKERKRGVKCIGCPEGCRGCSMHGETTSVCGDNSEKDAGCHCHTK